MELLKNINKLKLSSAFILLCILLSCSGCTFVDIVDPGVNNYNMLKTDPSTLVIYLSQDNTNDSQNGNSSESVSNEQSSGSNEIINRTGNLVVMPERFEDVKTSFISQSDYNDYLYNKVITPVNDILNSLDDDTKNSIYFRVWHKGYNISGSEVISASAYNYINTGNISKVSSRQISKYVVEWLCNAPYNSTLENDVKAYYLSRLNDFTGRTNIPSGFQNWGSVDYLTLKTLSGFPSDILKMMGSNEEDLGTIGSYMAAVQNDYIYNTIPNIKIPYYVSSSNKQYITLNNTNSLKNGVFDYNMSVSDLNRVFVDYNQFSTRDYNSEDKRYKDDCTYLYSYLDGYNRTIVLFSTNSDNKLYDLLGDTNLIQIFTIFDDIYNVTEFENIKNNMGSDFSCTIIEAGSRGTN